MKHFFATKADFSPMRSDGWGIFSNYLFIALLLGLAILTPKATAKPVPLDRLVAVVDQDAITQNELEKRLDTIEAQLEKRDIAAPPSEVLRKQVLDQLIIENVQLQLAERNGIRVDDRALNEAISRIAKQNGKTVEAFRKQLTEDGVSYTDARNEIRRELIINRVRQRLVARRIQVSEQEIDQYLRSPEAQSHSKVEYRLGHILVVTPDKPTTEQIQEAERKANKVHQQLLGGAEFSEMAIAYSSGQNALEGGDLGWRTASQLPSLFAEQALSINIGDITAPIRTPGGFHIFKLIETRGDEKTVEEQIYVRHILVQPNEIRSDEEARLLAEDLRKRILSGASFNELARTYSDDPGSALNGGNLEWISPKAMVPEFREAMETTPKNRLSKPFKSSFGWHILQVMGKRNSDISSKVRRDKAREIVGNRKFEEELQAWLREIRDQSYIEVRL